MWKKGFSIADREDVAAEIAREDSDSKPTIAEMTMKPFDVIFLLNPLIHEVLEITAGDRLCMVGFMGLTQ